MDAVFHDALVERVVSYLPFVVYEGKARSFVLCTQRGYVDATGLDLEHQHVRFSTLCTAILKNRNVDEAWQALCPTEQETIHLVCPETRGSDGCRALKERLTSIEAVQRLVAFLQFVSYEGQASLNLTRQTWRLLQFIAASIKGGSRSLQWTSDAWNALLVDEQEAWMKKFGPGVPNPKEIKTSLSEAYMHPYLDPLVNCQKRRDLLAFHALVLKTMGKIPEASSLPENKWRAVRALRALVDRDASPFPLALVALFAEDAVAVSALRDYFAFWIGEKKASVFKEYDGKFWQGHPATLYYVTHVIQRYTRLKSSVVRLQRFQHPKRGHCCYCDVMALYCKDCLEIKSIPNFSHPPPGRSVAIDINANRVVCQLCKSARVIDIPLFKPRNPSVGLSLSHPDRQPLHICDGSPFCFMKTSYLGSCGTC